MKRHPFPIQPPTLQNDTPSTDESQVVAVYDAPCRNRTCNLMIKSHGSRVSAARTEGVQPFPALSKVVELVPPKHPKSVRSIPPMSHGQSHVRSFRVFPSTSYGSAE